MIACSTLENGDRLQTYIQWILYVLVQNTLNSKEKAMNTLTIAAEYTNQLYHDMHQSHWLAYKCFHKQPN